MIYSTWGRDLAFPGTLWNALFRSLLFHTPPPPLPPSLFFFFFFFFSLLRSKKQACFRNSLANDFAEDRGDEMGILENLKSSSWEKSLYMHWFWFWGILVTARPKYRKNMSSSPEREWLGDNGDSDSKNGRESSYNSKLISERSRTLKRGIQQYKPVQVRTRDSWGTFNY